MTGMSTTVKMMSLILVVAVVVAAPAPAMGREQHAARQTPVVDGSSVYKTYCASCHGDSGRGYGAVAVFLRRRPADLTQICEAEQGRVPGGTGLSTDRRSTGREGTRRLPDARVG
jgi:cytochrome c553